MDWKLKEHTPFLLSCFNMLFWYGQDNNGYTSRFVCQWKMACAHPLLSITGKEQTHILFSFPAVPVVEMLIQKARMSLHFTPVFCIFCPPVMIPLCSIMNQKQKWMILEKKQNIVVLDQNYKLLNQEYWYDLNVLDTRKRVHYASWFKVSFDIAN